MKYKGPLGAPRLSSVGPLVTIDPDTFAQQAQQVGPQSDLTREEFIRKCKQSENAEDWAKGLASAYIGDEAAENIPTKQIEESSEELCEGMADFFGY